MWGGGGGGVRSCILGKGGEGGLKGNGGKKKKIRGLGMIQEGGGSWGFRGEMEKGMAGD